MALLASLAPFLLGLVGTTAHAEPIRGAGSTFASPIIQQWGRLYTSTRADGGDFVSPEWLLDYEPVGSLAGVMRLLQRDMDFAATDAPLPPEELTKRGYTQFPIVIGGVAAVVNIDGVQPGRLRLTGPLLASIYLGAITNWSDPAIAAVNPGFPLPDLKIDVLHRTDGSGTTFGFTEYLSLVSTEWKTRVGADTLVRWPVGSGAEGNQGLVRAVGSRRGSIAYIEYGQMRRAGLSYAVLQNKAGQFVLPEPSAFLAAAKAVNWAASRSFFQSLSDQPGETSYPMTVATFAVLPNRSADRVARVRDMFRIAFDRGATEAGALGYVPLPPELIEQVKRSWTEPTKTGG